MQVKCLPRHPPNKQANPVLFTQTDGEEKWRKRIDNLLTPFFELFFPNNTAFEHDCEGSNDPPCTTDMLSFKGYSHRWLAVVTQIAPYTRDTILPILRHSAQAAVNQCTGGPLGRKCGFYWTSGEYVDPALDETDGAGENMDVLAAVSSLLIDLAPTPATMEVDGISKGNPYDGSGGVDRGDGNEKKRITSADKVGATILTILIIGGGTWGAMWVTLF